jgi:NAD(P)-dependent dehydrogenase (short-subunit alcohol dehydrogenase family)
MASTDPQGSAATAPEVALIVGGGPGISASCARLFAHSGMAVAIAARNRDKPVLQSLVQSHGVRPYGCDAADAADVASLFEQVARDLGAPRLVVHNIDGGCRIFQASPKPIRPGADTLRNAAFSLPGGQQATG